MSILSNIKKKKLRTELEKALSASNKTKPIKLDIDGDILKELLFDKNQMSLSDYEKDALVPAIDWELIKKINLRNINFSGICIPGLDFTGSKGVVINPQTIYDRDLRKCKFSGVTFDGPFDGVLIYNNDFTGSKGAVINPQTIDHNPNCVFKDVTFIVEDKYDVNFYRKYWNFDGYISISPTTASHEEVLKATETYRNVLYKIRKIPR